MKSEIPVIDVAVAVTGFPDFRVIHLHHGWKQVLGEAHTHTQSNLPSEAKSTSSVSLPHNNVKVKTST